MKDDNRTSPNNCPPERKQPSPVSFKRPEDTEGGDHD